jgi:hypothetical protein
VVVNLSTIEKTVGTPWGLLADECRVCVCGTERRFWYLSLWFKSENDDCVGWVIFEEWRRNLPMFSRPPTRWRVRAQGGLHQLTYTATLPQRQLRHSRFTACTAQYYHLQPL